MKLLDIVRTASSNMLRSKLRTSLTVIAIFIGALTLTLTNGIGSGISSYIDRQLGNLGAEDVLIITPKGEAPNGVGDSGPSKYDPDKQTAATGNANGFSATVLGDADLAKIREVPGIQRADPLRSISASYVQGTKDDKYQLTIAEDFEGARYDLSAGKAVDVNGSGNQIMLPSAYVEPLGFSSAQDAVGKTIKVGMKNGLGQEQVFDGTITGVLNKGIISAGGASINREFNDKLYAYQSQGLPPSLLKQYPVITAKFDSKAGQAEEDRIKADLTLRGYSGSTVKDSIGVFKSVISAIISVLNFFAVIALLAASFGIVNTLLMAVQERTKEIGLMKAMGMRGGRIFLLFSIEAAMIGFWGSVLGVLVGVGIGQAANRIVSEGILKDLPGFQLLTFPIASIALTIGLIMLIAFLAGTLPARKAARQNPIDALRYE